MQKILLSTLLFISLSLFSMEKKLENISLKAKNYIRNLFDKDEITYISEFEYLLKLPTDMQNLILHEVLSQALIYLIKDYLTSHKSDKLKIFFKKISDLACINKQAAKSIRFYIPACTSYLDKVNKKEFLLEISSDKDWENFWILILANLNLLKEYISSDALNEVLINFAINKNKNMLNALLDTGLERSTANFDIKKNNVGPTVTINPIDVMEDGLPDSDIWDVKEWWFNAIISFNYKALKFFIKNNIDINLQHLNYGYTAILIASIRGRKDIIKLLIKNNANLDIQTRCGDTALILSILMERLDIAKLLIENGANVNLHNDTGRSAFNIAKLMGYEDVLKLLIEHGADENNINLNNKYLKRFLLKLFLRKLKN